MYQTGPNFGVLSMHGDYEEHSTIDSVTEVRGTLTLDIPSIIMSLPGRLLLAFAMYVNGLTVM